MKNKENEQNNPYSLTGEQEQASPLSEYKAEHEKQQPEEAEENLEGQHIINGKKVREGSMSTYTDQAGVKHDAVVKRIHQPEYFADLEARVDGSSKFFERVPFAPTGGNHAWSHKQDEEGHSTTHSSRTGRPHEVSGESDQQTDNG